VFIKNKNRTRYLYELALAALQIVYESQTWSGNCKTGEEEKLQAANVVEAALAAFVFP